MKCALHILLAFTTAALVTLSAGCELTGTSKNRGGVITPDLPCAVPGECDDFSSRNQEDLRLHLLRLFDQLEMSSGQGNEQRALPVTQELEMLLNRCPRLVLPQLIAQAQRQVHELQRGNLAMVLGWYPAGRACSTPVLTSMLTDPIPFVRFQAAAALLDLGDTAGVPVLLSEAAVHQNPMVRRHALAALSAHAGKNFDNIDSARAHYGR